MDASEVAKDDRCLCGRALKPDVTCGLCKAEFCKKCIEFLQPETFSFMTGIPEELTHEQYCLTCYAGTVLPALENYHETMARAKQIYFFDTHRRRPIMVLKKLEKPLLVEGCPDREETILRLAFKAAELGYNSVIKANVAPTKVRNAGYQKMIWQGTGVAAEVDSRSVDPI